MDNFPPYETKFIADLRFTPQYQEDRAGADFRESEYSVPSAERKQERGVKSRYLYVPWNASGAETGLPGETNPLRSCIYIQWHKGSAGVWGTS